MYKKLLLYFALLLWFVVPLGAQLTIISAPHLEAAPGEEIEAQITVSDFDEIVGMQFSIQWNPEILSFQSIENLALPSMTIANYGMTETNNGILRFSWTDPTLNGESLDDMTSVFNIKFLVAGAPSSISKIEITGKAMPIEVIGKGASLLDFKAEYGTITVSNPLEISNAPIEEGNLILYQNYPNPFKDFTFIKFKLKHPEYITLTVYNANGDTVFEHQQAYGVGTHYEKIDNTMVPVSGAYYYKLSTAQNSIIRTLISNY